MGVAHVAFDLGAGHERGHAVDDDDVDGAATYEVFAYLEGLLGRVGLGDQEVLGVHAALSGIAGVQGVLGVYIGGRATGLLGLSHDVVSEGRLAGRLGAEDLGDAAPGEAADTQGDVEGERAGRDGRGLYDVHVTEAHDGTVPELTVNLAQRGLEGLSSFRSHSSHVNLFGSVVLGAHERRPYKTVVV